MIVDSNNWTGADGKAWPHTLKQRSRYARFALLFGLMIPIIKAGLIISGFAHQGQMPSFSLIWVSAVIVISGVMKSPFRPLPKYRIVQRDWPKPDEFEQIIYIKYAALSLIPITICICGILLWVAVISATKTPLILPWADWVELAYMFLVLGIGLPTLIAEFRVPLPSQKDEEGL